MDAAASFAAWIAALNHPADRALLAAALTPTVRIERHHALPKDAPPPNPAEVFVGIDRAAEWIGRLQRATTFALVGAPREDDGRWTIEYSLHVDELEFDNGGLWVARLAGDGRIAELSHRPFPLPAQWR